VPETVAAVEQSGEPRLPGLISLGPHGLLKQFTKTGLESYSDEDMAEHLECEQHEKSAKGKATNLRNGTTHKKVLADSLGEVQMDVPSDWEDTFKPVIVEKRQRRLNNIESANAKLRVRGHFPTEQTTLKCLHCTAGSSGPTERNQVRRIKDKKPTLTTPRHHSPQLLA
jgi:transposase-like protein